MQTYRPFLTILGGRIAINPLLIESLDLTNADRGEVVVKMTGGEVFVVRGEDLEKIQDAITLV